MEQAGTQKKTNHQHKFFLFILQVRPGVQDPIFGELIGEHTTLHKDDLSNQPVHTLPMQSIAGEYDVHWSERWSQHIIFLGLEILHLMPEAPTCWLVDLLSTKRRPDFEDKRWQTYINDLRVTEHHAKMNEILRW